MPINDTPSHIISKSEHGTAQEREEKTGEFSRILAKKPVTEVTFKLINFDDHVYPPRDLLMIHSKRATKGHHHEQSHPFVFVNNNSG